MSARLPNAPYLKIDVLGRLIFNVYRTGRHRHDTPNPVVRWVDERGAFDVTRGVFVHVGRVGTFIALRSNGPAREKGRR